MRRAQGVGRSLAVGALCVVMGVSLAGCARHYRIMDVDTGTQYLAKGVKHRRGGAVTFRDAVSERKVTLDSWELEKMSKSDFRHAVYDARKESDQAGQR